MIPLWVQETQESSPACFLSQTPQPTCNYYTNLTWNPPESRAWDKGLGEGC